ncbi:MAG: NnrU family protein [Casimicrobiaceae bacterium]
MTLLIAGLVLFLGIHFVPAVPAWREAAVTRVGEQRYKRAFSLLSGVGLVLIVAGFALSERGPQLFAPITAARMIAPLVVTAALILIAAANMRSHLRATLRHPMLIGVLLWSGVHFLANGSLRASLLFGAFFIWAALDLVSAMARGAPRPFTPRVRFDAMSIGGGILVALVAMTAHRFLFGIRVVPFSL